MLVHRARDKRRIDGIWPDCDGCSTKSLGKIKCKRDGFRLACFSNCTHVYRATVRPVSVRYCNARDVVIRKLFEHAVRPISTVSSLNDAKLCVVLPRHGVRCELLVENDDGWVCVYGPVDRVRG